ncbi:hypothetical protein Tco_0344691, partial [Tanacetum coccineum]
DSQGSWSATSTRFEPAENPSSASKELDTQTAAWSKHSDLKMVAVGNVEAKPRHQPIYISRVFVGFGEKSTWALLAG